MEAALRLLSSLPRGSYYCFTQLRLVGFLFPFSFLRDTWSFDAGILATGQPRRVHARHANCNAFFRVA